jgi:hypothetical protein
MLIPNRCVLVSESENLRKQELCEKREQLTNWEEIFLWSVGCTLNAAGKLSDKQVERLNEIWRAG